MHEADSSEQQLDVEQQKAQERLANAQAKVSSTSEHAKDDRIEDAMARKHLHKVEDVVQSDSEGPDEKVQQLKDMSRADEAAVHILSFPWQSCSGVTF